MNFVPVTKLDKRKRRVSKKFDNDAMSTDCDKTFIFLIYDQFGEIWKPLRDAKPVEVKFSLTVIFYFTKTENRTEKSITQLSNYCFQ